MSGRPKVIKVAGLLLLSAAVNIAMAWGCAMWSHTGAEWHQLYLGVDEIPEDFRRRVPAAWLQQPPPEELNLRLQAGTDRRDGFGLRLLMFHARIKDMAVTSFGRQEHCVIQSGWPMLCMEAEGRVEWKGGWTHIVTWAMGWRSPASAQAKTLSMSPSTESSERPIPRRVLLGAFAINTLFYAATVWLVFAIPLALRRELRRKRGLCAMCAYPIGGSDVCAECGAAITPSPRGAHEPVRTAARG